MNQKHPLEVLLNASAWDILSAVQKGFRAIIDVKGKLAEYFLEHRIAQLHLAGEIDSYMWQDIDGQPDFLITVPGKTLRIECKNIRSEVLFTKPVPGYKAELQKTRNSKDGTPTRAYRFSEFDILAVCLFNHTKKWEYLFIATRDLTPRPDAPDLIKIMQHVPFQPSGPWKPDLLDVLGSL
ncbi:MAG: hypothetical protein NTU53_05015 [Planctomycetota bacterium]|nr:hypothetical protein [Planctomycetota bacterium]